jgi:hypothetical protein
MTWIVIVSLGLLTLAALLSREMDEPPCGSSAQYDFAVLVRPMMASFRKVCVNFVQNWHIYKSISLFCRVRLSDYIYITQ